MTYDKKIADLFLMNFNEAYRSAKLLVMSFHRTSKLIPITFEEMIKMSPDNLDRLDAFRVRFCDLQDSLGNKIFRSILALEEEEIGSQLDILNKMEKRQIFSSFNEWKNLRNVRNLFAHDYPDTDDQKAEALNIAHKYTFQLIEILNNVKKYAEKEIGFPMEKFDRIGKNLETQK